MALDPDGKMPQTIGQYRVERVLGQGGQGTVYKALDTWLQRPVAMKVPRADLAQIPEVREAFIAEAQIGAMIGMLKHPSLCTVYACQIFDDTPHLAMEFVEGATLSDFRTTRWLVPSLKEAVEIVQGLARALAAFHGCTGSPLHRDLKPGNVRVTPAPERRPVLIDFGLALRLSSATDHRPEPGAIVGTPEYMAPEQFVGGGDPLCHATDIYAVGAILYELLTGKPPFELQGLPLSEALRLVLNKTPTPPSQINRSVSKKLDDVCLKALAKSMRDRFQTMTEFADRLAELDARGPIVIPGPRPLVQENAIRFVFAGYGEVAPPALEQSNRLFLDVGNGLRAGVIDHHHIVGTGSVSRTIADHLNLIDAAVAPGGADNFTIVLHQSPDLDCVVSAYLAIAYLTTRKLPEGIASLADYVDRVDAGEPVMSAEFPYTLYAAQRQLLTQSTHSVDTERWNRAVRDGLKLVAYVIEKLQKGETIDSIDAFACPGLFGSEDRATVMDDQKRYAAKLAAPQTSAKLALLRLPAQFGGPMDIDALLVRDVQNPQDPAGVRYFKIWARSDAQRSPQGRGFEALSVFSSEDARHRRRCILSVTPESAASLRGLGARLEAAEAAERVRINGVDDRKVNPVTNELLVPRPGYDNADPWYDGKSHSYTIIDSPRRGTLLDADTIERIFLEFGQGQASSLPPL